jgi:hypothetical protein
MQGIEATTQVFLELAGQAKRRLCVVTPFIDETAAPILLQQSIPLSFSARVPFF